MTCETFGRHPTCQIHFLLKAPAKLSWGCNLTIRTSGYFCTAREAPTSRMQAHNSTKETIKLVLVGDVHECWDPALDHAALRFLRPDAAIFVGDFGNEAVDIVRDIANVRVPKAVMLGNHDAWGPLRGLNNTDKVDSQIEALGLDYIGYGANQFITAGGSKFSVVGCRPYSSGRPKVSAFTKARHNISNMEGSAVKVSELILRQPAGLPIILVGHNGPAGLGSSRYDPCGRDFSRREGDHGDADMARAIQMVAKRHQDISLVTFGHMHEQLQDAHVTQGVRWTQERRNMVDISPETGLVYLNCAVVPRHRNINGKLAAHFVVVILEDKVVMEAQNVWIADASKPQVVAVETLIRSRRDDKAGLCRSFYKAYEGIWSPEIPLPLATEAHSLGIN